MNRTIRTSALAIGIVLAAVAFSASVHAASLREGSSGATSEVTGALPGQVLWTSYQTDDVATLSYSTALDAGYVTGFSFPGGTRIILIMPSKLPPTPTTTQIGPCTGSIIPFETTVSCPADNVLRLVNPNGGANSNLVGSQPQTVCAMIYVFDDDQEMGECCGCPLSSTQLATFSVEGNLTSNWGLGSGSEGGENTNGAIAIVAAAPNGLGGTCDPTNVPGYSVTTASNLQGSITNTQTTFSGLFGVTLSSVSDGNTQNFVVDEPKTSFRISAPAVTETALFDDAGGDPTNLTYLQTQCGALVGNGTGGGICNCPTE